jgi:hypothetical protein
MPTIDVHPVSTTAERRAFLTLPWRIYHDDPMWVLPLLSERRKRIDPTRGPLFRHGDAEFFLAWRGRELVGTICAAEDRERNAFRHERDGIFGFFECIDDYDVAVALFETAAAWVRSRGLSSLLGPFHLDYEDSYGIVLEGHDTPQVLLCGQTPPYYRDFAERYGFVSGRAGDNIAYRISLVVPEDDPRLQRLARIADLLERRGQVSARPARIAD